MAVKKADNYKCFVTGKNYDLQCHHLIGFAYEPTRYDPNNGVTLHVDVHNEFHNQYGRGGNLPEQFEEFCREKYNITTFPWREGNRKPSLSIMQHNLVSGINQRAKEFEKLVESRDHQIVSGTYTNNRSVFEIKCLEHDTVSEVKVQRYKNAAYGAQCCAKAKQSKTTGFHNKLRPGKPKK